MEKIFYTDEDTDLYIRNGAKVKVLREIDSKAATNLDLKEGERGFVIRFSDGYETEVYESEVKEMEKDMRDKKWKFRDDMLDYYINNSSNKTFQDAEDRLNFLEEFYEKYNISEIKERERED